MVYNIPSAIINTCVCRMATLPRLLPLVMVLVVVPQLLATSCLTNQDCGSGCCSGYGWCVGPRSGQGEF